MQKAKKTALLFALIALVAASGCKRSEEAYDNRTLEKRPHVESVKPDDKKDPFRP